MSEYELQIEANDFKSKPQSAELEPPVSEFSSAFEIGDGYIEETIEQDMEKCAHLFEALGLEEDEGKCILEHIRSYYNSEEDKRQPEDGAFVKLFQATVALVTDLSEANVRAGV